MVAETKLREPAEKKTEVRESGISGRGLFATARISKGEFLFEYLGERVDDAEGYARDSAGNVYILDLENGWCVDGGAGGNESIYMNHSCEPNIDLRYEDDGGIRKPNFYALRDIEPGEELTWDYEWTDYKECECKVCKEAKKRPQLEINTIISR